MCEHQLAIFASSDGSFALEQISSQEKGIRIVWQDFCERPKRIFDQAHELILNLQLGLIYNMKCIKREPL